MFKTSPLIESASLPKDICGNKISGRLDSILDRKRTSATTIDFGKNLLTGTIPSGISHPSRECFVSGTRCQQFARNNSHRNWTVGQFGKFVFGQYGLVWHPAHRNVRIAILSAVLAKLLVANNLG
jgi:hypothetical protein